MRKILIGALVAAGIGAVGISAGSAAPVNNTVLDQIAKMNDSATQVGWHGPDRSHWRWGSRGPWRHRCHVRFRSWWRFC